MKTIILTISVSYVLIGCGSGNYQNPCASGGEILQQIEDVYNSDQNLTGKGDLRQCYFNISGNKPQYSEIDLENTTYHCYTSEFNSDSYDYEITLCGLKGDWKVYNLYGTTY